MSGTSPTATSSATAGPASSRSSSPHPIARRGAPAALVVGSLLAAAGMALHLPAMAEDVGLTIAIAEAPTRWLASHLLLGFGFAIVAVGAAGLLHALRRDRGATLTAMGAIAMTLGAITMAVGDIAHGAVGFALTEVDPATSFEIHGAYFEHPAILAVNTGPMLVSVGMFLVGGGLLRSRALPRWLGIVVLLTPIGVNLGFNLGLPPFAPGIPFAVGTIALAIALTRMLQATAPASRPA
ncbi:hypothetical protein [Egicoccus sp. AB-alg2]|uniref:hypothetical protein n=1 Tax=Egicoccus sp. AB-alg2 TaxID=3242693 RepID=UPI00359D2D7A